MVQINFKSDNIEITTWDFRIQILFTLDLRSNNWNPTSQVDDSNNYGPRSLFRSGDSIAPAGRRGNRNRTVNQPVGGSSWTDGSRGEAGGVAPSTGRRQRTNWSETWSSAGEKCNWKNMVNDARSGNLPMVYIRLWWYYMEKFRTILVAKSELSTGRMDPRVGSGRVGSGRVGSGRVGSGRVGSGRVGSGHDFAGFWRVGSGRVGSALRIF